MGYDRRSVAHEVRGVIYLLATLTIVGSLARAKTESSTKTADTGAAASSTVASSSTACAGNNDGLALPPGFCATVFADNIGHPRHIVVNSNGDVYVNTWSGKYYSASATPGLFFVTICASSNRGRSDV